MLSPPKAGTAEQQARFEAVYAACHVPILSYALRRTSSPDDAADILAETFLIAWRRLDEVPPGQDARLWLYRVARNVLANYHRGERRRSALADRLHAELAQTPTTRRNSTARPPGSALRCAASPRTSANCSH